MDPLTTTADIDTRLATVARVLDQLGGDLFDLDNNNPTRVLLSTTPLSGRTAAEWDRADDRIRLLWVLYGRLRDTLGHATDLRGKGSRLRPPQLAEVAALLSEPAVALPPDMVTLAGEVLDGTGPLAATARVDQLLDTASWLNARLTATVSAVGAVWDQVLPRLGQFDATLTQLEAAAAAGGVRAPNELAHSRRDVEQLRQLAATDPLAADAEAVERVALGVDQSRRAVEEANSRRSGAEGRDDQIRADLEALAGLVARLNRDQDLAAERILGTPDRTAEIAAARAEVDELRAGLSQAEEQASADPDLARRRLAQVAQQVQIRRDRLAELVEVVGAGLVRRDELRGRLGGYQAMAASQGRAEDATLDDLFARASDLLYAAPCDLEAAARSVEDYQRCLTPPTTIGDR